jgi:hypothetical protein
VALGEYYCPCPTCDCDCLFIYRSSPQCSMFFTKYPSVVCHLHDVSYTYLTFVCQVLSAPQCTGHSGWFLSCHSRYSHHAPAMIGGPIRQWILYYVCPF